MHEKKGGFHGVIKLKKGTCASWPLKSVKKYSIYSPRSNNKNWKHLSKRDVSVLTPGLVNRRSMPIFYLAPHKVAKIHQNGSFVWTTSIISLPPENVSIPLCQKERGPINYAYKKVPNSLSIVSFLACEPSTRPTIRASMPKDSDNSMMRCACSGAI
jgi:hypothetical protein